MYNIQKIRDMIELSNIHFGYSKKRPLFQDLNMTMQSGHIYGLLGKNGAGKTTLLKIMTGLCFPQQGTPLIFGKRAEQRHSEVLSNIYFLPEELYTPHLKMSDYVCNYARFYPNFNHEQLAQYLADFELTGYDGFMDKLSHGQKKKIHIAFALAANTQILIMDEPTNGLDIPSKSIFRKVMASAVNENQMVVISTHQVRDLHSLIDSIIILDNGSVIINEENDRITEKLLFQVEAHGTENTQNDILYSEDTLQGIYTVKENTQQIENKLDIELFFNAVMCNKNQIQNIFNSKS